MRVMVFAKTTKVSEKGSFATIWRTGAPASKTRFAAKLMGCAAAFLAMSGSAIADSDALYPRMAPIDTYLLDRDEEIALARGAAPKSISKDATILVLTRTGYETAVTGTNGFVCMVARGFSGPFEWPERFNPKIRAAECLNPPAARSVMPFAKLRTAMFLAGSTTVDTVDRIKTALSAKEIPPLEPGAMSYMMSKSSYLTDEGDHNMPHLMFFVPVADGADWGANVPDSPVIGGDYWFFAPGNEADTAKLPTISVFITEVTNWSDGTPVPAHGCRRMCAPAPAGP